MKNHLSIPVILLLMLTLLLTSCGNDGSKDPEENQDSMVTETEGKTNTTEAVTPATTEATETMDQDSDDEKKDLEDAETEEVEIEVGLIDRALLESVKFNWPDSMMMVVEEDNNGVVSLVTSYQKGYSTREETLTEGVTEIEIYNEALGTSYEYTLGEATGTSYKDDEDDVIAMEESKAMNGQSLMSLFEMDMWTDMKIKADVERVKGRKAIKVELISLDAEDGAEPMMKLWFDAKYSVALEYVYNFGEDWQTETKLIEVDFNLKLKDELFEAPEDVSFMAN